jgi:uncharacterized protein
MMHDKEKKLIDIIRQLVSVVIGFSGGVDSTLIAYLCIEHLGLDDVWVVTANSKSIMPEEIKFCQEITTKMGIAKDHFAIINTNELDDPNYTANPENRCYFCRQELFGRLREYALKVKAENIVDGSNASDLTDYRPGMKAGKELKVRSPFAEVGFTKDDVRKLAKRLGLPNWDKPATPCLSSRIPYHSKVTLKKLEQIATAERFLKSLGFKQVRVRHHGQIARLEIEDFDLLFKNDIKKQINKKLKKTGFTYVAVDLGGFRSGSLNDAIKEKRKR